MLLGLEISLDRETSMFQNADIGIFYAEEQKNMMLRLALIEIRRINKILDDLLTKEKE
jgi:hypothetical protein